ncbi:helix-turn-helix domain-containing protein [Terriglobus saanensis]|uniref:Transcriptional regulator, AraC family n=1 Tax=Terriglobus saanensis (strain ATCC BAA-1853 / DSM 23119 / SP1PR4) TaxID=401053 RepID=E8V3I4_TERSS|nr:AraC family transcriptional regulator [Terriglobus saanensis]ADV83597.1 transcriptional regulator, AraC family [Terriglobus saanensis SP1PR4]
MLSTSIDSYRPMKVIASSADLPWEGFVVEKSISSPGILVPTSLDKHSIWQMVGPLSARGERSTGRGGFTSYAKVPGDITIVPAGPVPDVRLFPATELICCTFDKSFTEGISGEMDRRVSDAPVFSLSVRDATTTRLLDLLTEELEAGAQSGQLYAESLAQALAVRFLTSASALSRRLHARVSPLPPAILRKVKDLIENNFTRKLSLKTLASESGYSRAHFLRMFYASCGVTPHDYLVDRRLSHAKHLLKRARSPIAAIALECGFSSQAHMTSLFRQKLGVTPGDFRRSS